jgi:phage baseplate assembly protein V
MTPWEIRKLVKSTIRGEVGRLRGLVRRGVLGAVTPGQGAVAQVKSTFGDVDDDVEIFQQHGFYSVPVAGGEAVLLRAGGAREHTIAIAAGDRSLVPPGVLGGEVCVYHPSGSMIVMRTDGSIEITPGGAGLVNIGAPEPTEFVALASLVLAELNAIRTAYDAHVHPDPVAGTTGAPTTLFGGPAGDVAATKARAL